MGKEFGDDTVGGVISWETNRNWFSLGGSLAGTIGGKVAFTVSFRAGVGFYEDVIYISIVISPVGSRRFHSHFVSEITGKRHLNYPFLLEVRKGWLRRKREEIVIGSHISQLFDEPAKAFTRVADILRACGKIVDGVSPAKKEIRARVGSGVHFDG